MELTKEMLAKAKEAKTAEELIALAKENGMEMTDEQAKENFAKLHQSGELSDDELNNVAGGGCGSSASTGYTLCPKCHSDSFHWYKGDGLWHCKKCGYKSGDGIFY